MSSPMPAYPTRPKSPKLSRADDVCKEEQGTAVEVTQALMQTAAHTRPKSTADHRRPGFASRNRPIPRGAAHCRGALPGVISYSLRTKLERGCSEFRWRRRKGGD